MYTDSIADFLTRIRNASHARRQEVRVKYSRLLKSITEVLMAKRFIQGFEEITTETGRKEIVIQLIAGREPLELKRISKPGQRIYVGHEELKRVRNGLGIGILSTSQGVLPDAEVRKLKIGGEYICEVY